MDSKPCACGCGGHFVPKIYWNERGKVTSLFISGHNSKIGQKSIEKNKWKKDMMGKLFCSCGCGETLVVNDGRYYRRGKPLFCVGHNYGERSGYFKCDFCGKTHLRSPSRKSKHGKFCSNKCWYGWLSANLVGERCGHYKKVKVLCDWCKKDFMTHPSALKKGKTHFCSIQCYDKEKAKRWGVREQHPQYKGEICSISGCGGERYYRPKYHVKALCKIHTQADRMLQHMLRRNKIKRLDLGKEKTEDIVQTLGIFKKAEEELKCE